MALKFRRCLDMKPWVKANKIDYKEYYKFVRSQYKAMLAKAQRRKMEKMVKENRKQIRGYKGEPLRIGEFVMYKTKPVSLKGQLPGSYGW
eukprot:105376_1